MYKSVAWHRTFPFTRTV